MRDRFDEMAEELKQAISKHAYPAADGGADIDNGSIPIIAAKLRAVAEESRSLKPLPPGHYRISGDGTIHSMPAPYDPAPPRKDS